MSDHYIPKEILSKIFRKLPLESLFRCTAVCKLWHHLINSPQLLSTHFQNPNQQLLLLRFHTNNDHYLSLRFSNNQTLDEYSSITPSLPLSQSSYIVGSCKGLLCVFLDETHMLSLWNPIVRIIQFLPKPAFPIHFRNRNVFGFGFGLGLNSCSYDFKILHLLKLIPAHQESTLLAEMYSLKDNSWKEILCDQFDDCLIPHRAIPAFVNGALHCVASVFFGNFIIVFDMTSEVFSRMELPRSLMNAEIKGLSILPFGDSSIVVTSTIDDGVYTDIWVIKEYNVEGSWVKFPTVGEYARGRSSVLWIKDCEDVLMEFSGGYGQIAWFNFEKQRVMTVVDNVKSVRCFPFVESLEIA